MIVKSRIKRVLFHKNRGHKAPLHNAVARKKERRVKIVLKIVVKTVVKTVIKRAKTSAKRAEKGGQKQRQNESAL